MSNVTPLHPVVDHSEARMAFNNFFVGCVGTGDDRLLLDVVITDSLIKEFKPEGEQRRLVDNHKAFDVNFVFGNSRYRTFRVFAEHWNKVIKMVKDLTNYSGELEMPDDPRHWITTPKNKAHHYQQQVVMQDLGVDFHISTLDSPESTEYWQGVTDGDFTRMEDKFDSLSKTYTDAAKRVKANIETLITDTTIVRNHNLFFSHFIDFDKRHLAVSLTRLNYKVNPDNPSDFELDPKSLVADDFKDVIVSPLGVKCLERLETAFSNFNAFVDVNFSKDENQHPALTLMEDLLFKRMWSQIMPMAEQVYDMRADSMPEEVKAETEALLQHIKELSENPGLDLTSYKVWDYTDADNSTLVTDLGTNYLLNFRPEFVKLIINNLNVMRHPLCRPHAVMKLVTDKDEIKARPIGDVKTERF